MDPVKDFFADLKSPDPSIRFSVLSRIEDLAWNEQQQAALKNLIAQEKDPGLRFHMQKVLTRLDQSDKSRAGAGEIEKLLNDPNRDEITLALMLEGVKRTDAHLITGSLRSAGWSNFSPQLLPSVLKFLKKYGSFEDAGEIEMLCRHHDPRVLSAAIEALEKIAPDRLKDLIVPLLVNPNFGIRSRAVRLLHRWDPNEALRHFEAMLFSQVDSEKQAALFHAFFFPFNQIEKLLLRFISVEKDEELIKKAGLLFMTNPNGQSPARLLEVRQACVGEKYRLVENILKGVLTSLFQAKIVQATPEQMLGVLENHYRQKRLKLFIERYCLGLQSEDAQTRMKAAIKLCDLVRYDVAEARQVIENYLETEPSREIKQKIAGYLQACHITKKEPEPQPEKVEPQSPEQLLQAIDSENFAEVLVYAQQKFKELQVNEQISVIKAIEQFGQKQHAELPARALKSDNAEVLASAIDCLGKIDADILLPYLPQLMKHSSDEVREAAIKVFALFDKQQAIALVEKMLFSMQPVQRKHAILCCGHFDFQSVAHLVLKALKIEGDPENQQQIRFLLLSNADEELFYKLYADFKACNTSKKALYEDICGKMAEHLSTGENPIDKQQLYQVAIEKLEEEEKCQSQRQAYKLEKIQEIRKGSETKTAVDAGLVKFTIAAYAAGAVLTALIWFLFLAPGKVAPHRPDNATTRPARLPQTAMVKGKVRKVDSGKRIVEVTNSLEDNRVYQIRYPVDFGSLPEPGDNFNGQVRPISDGKEVSAEIIAAL